MMELEMIKILLWIIGDLTTLLTVVIGYIGARIHGRLDAISSSLAAIERALRRELVGLDRRITHLEAKDGQ